MVDSVDVDKGEKYSFFSMMDRHISLAPENPLHSKHRLINIQVELRD
jgi:hypothetical protein